MRWNSADGADLAVMLVRTILSTSMFARLETLKADDL